MAPKDKVDTPPPVKVDRSTLQKFYNSPQLSDITICFSDRRVRAHKMVLSLATPYFQNAFTSGFAESASTEMWLYEDDPDAVHGMLRHFYGLEARGAVTSPGIYFYLRLFTVASKYDVPTLLDEAVKAVKDALSDATKASWFPDMVYQIYEELPIHQRELRVAVTNACQRNIQELFKTKRFKELLMDVPAFSIDMMQSVLDDY
ncbi:hypothetical protein PRZ48_005690 [Zasmidium cellare]|uniref:BTB domain-containing protein n=1 Tax=Zasmidium cellare TaxID=395010 RepID=A0ABR0EL88_ZASCE|nr:hypothetical protein PRZ48_005690 [Zasmidium cellare]